MCVKKKIIIIITLIIQDPDLNALKTIKKCSKKFRKYPWITKFHCNFQLQICIGKLIKWPKNAQKIKNHRKIQNKSFALNVSLTCNELCTWLRSHKRCTLYSNSGPNYNETRWVPLEKTVSRCIFTANIIVMTSSRTSSSVKSGEFSLASNSVSMNVLNLFSEKKKLKKNDDKPKGNAHDVSASDTAFTRDFRVPVLVSLGNSSGFDFDVSILARKSALFSSISYTSNTWTRDITIRSKNSRPAK